MRVSRRRARVAAWLAVVILLPLAVAQAQEAPAPGAPPPPSAPPPASPPPAPSPSFETRPAQPLTPGTEPSTPPPATAPAPAPSFETRPGPPLTPGPAPAATQVETLDGHPRYGSFLSGPGSLTFILHHTLMGAAGGLATQGIARGFSLDPGSLEQMLAGLLIGGGVGFGVSAWWQYSHWIGRPTANFGIAASLISGMFFTGLVDLASNDPNLLAWTAFAGAELGAWLSLALAGGDFHAGTALAIGSGAAWGLAYGGLLLAILSTSGTRFSAGSSVDTLLIAPGLGAGFIALSMLHFKPTIAQVLRADLFGAVAGAGVLLITGLALGVRFDVPLPYILSLVASAGTIGAVSILWEDKAEPSRAFLAEPRDDRYRSVWW